MYGSYDNNGRNLKLLILIADLSCSVVLLHTGWCMKKLREVAHADDNGRKATAVNLKKLILLMAFCVSVIFYVFFTRIVVYALEMVIPHIGTVIGPVCGWRIGDACVFMCTWVIS